MFLQSTINTTFGGKTHDVDMAIYFMTEGGGVERRDHTCLFCERIFPERKALNEHYLEEHSIAFSAEELIMAAARRDVVVTGRTVFRR